MKRRTFFDLTVILIFAATAFLIASRIDMLEAMVNFVEHHEQYELDELLPLSIALAICFMYFSARRWHDAKKQYERAEKQNVELQKP